MHHCNEHLERMANLVCEILLTEAPLDAPQKHPIEAGAMVEFWGKFFTRDNGLTVLRQISTNVCLSIGMTLVILSGGIDLSVGSVLAPSTRKF